MASVFTIKVECKDLQQVREIISILIMMTKDPRISENIRNEYIKKIQAIKFEGDE